MSLIHQRGRAQMQANLTPMIDVTFLLIVFFVLVSQIVEVENVEMRLPELEEPMTALPGEERRAVINVVPGLGGAALEYRVGGRSIPVGDEGAERLTGAIAALLRANPSLRVNLRADRRTEYGSIQPVLKSVAAASSAVPGSRPRLNLVVLREE